MLEVSQNNSFGFFRNLGRVRQVLEGMREKLEHQKPLKYEDQIEAVAAPRQHVQADIPSAEPEKILRIEPTPISISTSDASIQTDEKVKKPKPKLVVPAATIVVQQPPQPVVQPLSVLERLEMRFLRQTVNQYNEDTQILYGNFTDSLRVIEALKKKVADQQILLSSTYDCLKVENKKLSFSNTSLKDQLKNSDRLVEFWKKRFEILKEVVKKGMEQEQAFPLEDSRLIAQLQAENSSLRSMLQLAYSDVALKKFEMKIEETESDFYNNHCSKNPPPSDLEIKYMTSQNKGLNKDFKKFNTVEKSFQPTDLHKKFDSEGINKAGAVTTASATIVTVTKKVNANSLDGPQINNFLDDESQGEQQKEGHLRSQESSSNPSSGSTFVEGDQQSNVVVVSVANGGTRKLAMSAKELKSFNESNSKFENLMKKLSGDSSGQQAEKVKQAQLRIIEGESQLKQIVARQEEVSMNNHDEEVFDSEELQIEVEEEEDYDGQEGVRGTNDNHNRFGVQAATTTLTTAIEHSSRIKVSQEVEQTSIVSRDSTTISQEANNDDEEDVDSQQTRGSEDDYDDEDDIEVEQEKSASQNVVFEKQRTSHSEGTGLERTTNSISQKRNEQDVDGEEDGQDYGDEQENYEEEGEYFDDSIQFNEYYGTSKYVGGSQQQQHQQQAQEKVQQQQSQKDAYELSDKARMKEMLLMQSKQLSQQMSKPKFFKPNTSS